MKSNNYPLIMVHGLMGWGNDEFLGINYWGGNRSLRQDIINQGYEVYTPTIGPISSNWDRACELYAYIKGGIVDYGEAHSKKYGHSRYGRSYPGIYKNIDDVHKIHLIGHSMGGQTSRVLVQLLEEGSIEEKASTGGNISPLFIGGHHWVHSVTTIATPHDGSVAAYVPNIIEPLTQQLFAALAIRCGKVNLNNSSFDYKLDQWGLKKLPTESYTQYHKKVMGSNLWSSTKDFSLWDLLPEGARELNQWVKAQSEVYYFSIACRDTHRQLLSGHQIPNINMNPVFFPSSLFIGSFTKNKHGEVKIDRTWWENDGLVSVRSEKYPQVGSKDKMIKYNKAPKKGVWNYLGLVDNIDHEEMVRMLKYGEMLRNRYYALVKMLGKLA